VTGCLFLLIIMSCSSNQNRISQDYFDNVRQYRSKFDENQCRLTEFDFDGNVVNSSYVLTKKDGHFLIQLDASSNFGPRDKLVCYNPLQEYQFELERTKDSSTWHLVAIDNAQAGPIGNIRPGGVYRNFWSPLSVGLVDLIELIKSDDVETTYKVNAETNELIVSLAMKGEGKKTLPIRTAVFHFSIDDSGEIVGLKSRKLVFQNKDTFDSLFEYEEPSLCPARSKNFRNGMLVGNIKYDWTNQVSEPVAVFTLAYYGFPDPFISQGGYTMLNGPSLLIILGIAICAVGILIKLVRQ
jgi:hypothetical protein